MDLLVLGPMRATAGGNDVALGGQLQRTVLALLAVAGRDGLHMDQLLMGTYGPDADPARRRSILTFISRHRSNLGDNAILRQGDRYRLGPGVELDSDRFESLLAPAPPVRTAQTDVPTASAALPGTDAGTGRGSSERVSIGTGASTERIRLRSALDSWRGVPFADIDATAVIAERTRLQHLHHEALVRWAELELLIGNHREVAQRLIIALPHVIGTGDTSPDTGGEVTAETSVAAGRLAASENGRLDDIVTAPDVVAVSLLATALHRCGQAERAAIALAHARDIHVMATSPRGDEALATAAAEIESGRTPATARRPSRAVHTAAHRLIGREDELRTVIDTVETSRLVTITGPGGIGKTRLAVAVAAALDDRFDVVSVPLPPEPGSDPLVEIALAFGCRPGSADDACDTVAAIVAARPTLVVVDECDLHLDRLADAAHRLLRSAPGIRLLLASRTPLDSIAEVAIELRPLPIGASSPSAELFVERCPHLDAGADDERVERIVALTAGHPLTLELAAANARTSALDHLAASLEQQIADLRVRTADPERHASLRATFNWSYERLTDDERRWFRLLSIFTAGGIPLDGASAVLAADPEAALSQLAERSLVGFDQAAGRWRMLEPIRQFGRGLLDDAGETDDVTAVHRRWLIEACETAIRLSLDGRYERTIAHIDQIANDVIATARTARAAGDAETVLRLVAGVGATWTRSRPAIELSDTALWAIDAGADVDPDVRIPGLVATTYLASHAQSDRSTELIDAIHTLDTTGLAPMTQLRAESCRFITLPMRAHRDSMKAYTDRALELLDSCDRLRATVGLPAEPTLLFRSDVEAVAGRPDDARRSMDALLAWVEADRPVLRAWALEFCATSSYLDGDLDLAMARADEATDLLTAAGDVSNIASVEHVRAWCHACAEDFDAAHDAMQRAAALNVTIGQQLDNPIDDVLRAIVAAGRADWPSFLAAAATLLSNAAALPAEALDEFLLNTSGRGGHFSEVIVPTAKWLAATDRRDDAIELLTWAPAVFAASDVDHFESSGEVRRVEQLLAALTDMPSAPPPDVTLRSTFDRLHQLIIG